MTEQSLATPDWGDVPVNDDAEPTDAHVDNPPVEELPGVGR